jgi:ParB family chromosome partitioning protein
MESITNNASDEVKEEFKKGTIGISAAYEVSKLPQEEQKEIAKQVAAGDDIRAKEIALKVAERTATKAAEEAEEAQVEAIKQAEQTVKEIEKAERKQEEAEQFAKNADDTAKQAKILREWVTNSTKTATVKAAEAVLKVSESDIPQESWNSTDWVVYTLKGIMESADKVTEDELYTLQDILRLCNSEERNK